jgi:acetylornithine deacetylase/succinyl-diaminopimelate desuccinylase-like protein
LASGAYEPFPASFELAHLNWPFMLEIAFRGPLNSPNMRAALHDTMSITILAAGNKVNVIPSTAEADVDCRLLPNSNVAAFMRRVRKAAGTRINVEARLRPIEAKASPASGPLWEAIATTIATDFPNLGFGPSMTTAVTDSRFLRARGVPTYGFIPMVLTGKDVKGIHGVDERLSIENFNRGLRATYDMTKELCAEKRSSKPTGLVAAR